jgi:two-component system, chemotaxis family, chemotaxis protein CheY
MNAPMLKVLVVDDSKVMRRMVVRSLELSGLEISEVQEAESGTDALDVLHRMWIDVVLCDVHMPKMSGVELVRRMSEDRLTASVPVVMVSSDRNQAQIDELHSLGVRGYVIKPFQPEALARTVQQVLGLNGAP